MESIIHAFVVRLPSDDRANDGSEVARWALLRIDDLDQIMSEAAMQTVQL